VRGIGFLISGFELGMVFESVLARHGAATNYREGAVKIVLAVAVLVVLLASEKKTIGFE
jgi:hypothetical protein